MTLPTISCVSFWISMASTVGWQTFLTVCSVVYINVKVVYTWGVGGTIKYSTIGGLTIEEKAIAPGTNIELPGNLSGACFSFSNSYHGGGDRVASESGCGSLALVSTYPTRGFDWSLNNGDALNSGVQLIRRLLKLPILEEEQVAWTKMLVSLVGFVLGIVGLSRDPESVPRSMRAIFSRGEVPDIRVFTLLVSIASITGFVTGVLFGFAAYKHGSAREAVYYPRIFWSAVWIALSLVSFGIGCWQIDVRRKEKESVLGMFIYWVPVTTVLSVGVCGVNVTGILGIVGTVFGIMSGSAKSC